MGDDVIKIDIEKGGTVVQGQPFRWQNHGPSQIEASGLDNVCETGSYKVPGEGGGKCGEKDAKVLSTATLGDHTYSTGPGGTTPVLKVNNTMPR
jgi:hypothetical protein